MDGEHGWRAACDLGWEQIHCEIIEADDFEAMRQCYSRNRHGSDDPVLLGRMFQKMLAEGKLTQRQLADMLGLADGTVRNYLAYAEAAKLRNDCAPETADRDIAGLRVQDVAHYLKLAANERDEWLDRLLLGHPAKRKAKRVTLDSIDQDDLLDQLSRKIAGTLREWYDDEESALESVRSHLDPEPWATVYLLAAILPGISLKQAALQWLQRVEDES